MSRRSQHATRERKTPTEGQLRYVRSLRQQLKRPDAPLPATWRKAVNEIDLLLLQAGRPTDPRVKRPNQIPLSNAEQVKVSIARDRAATHARETIADEQARLKLEASERRARAAELAQRKTDSASAAD